MAENSNRSVLITGASTGIGEGCALELDRLGWRVFAAVRSEEAAQRLEQKSSDRLTTLKLDVTETADIAEAARLVSEVVGNSGLDGLVNNAGIAVPGPIEALPMDDIRRQLEVNFFGQIAVTQAMLPMLRQAEGRIVMMSSISGRVSPPFLGAYAASKFALEAASDALRIELHRVKVDVSLVEPGSVVTPIWGKAHSTAEQIAEKISPEMMQLYGDDIQRIGRMIDSLAASGMPVSRVIRAVVHALTASRPKTRYVLGTQPKLATTLFPFFSDRTCDWIIRRELGLS